MSWKVFAIVRPVGTTNNERHLVEHLNNKAKAINKAESLPPVWEGGDEGPKVRLFPAHTIIRYELEQVL